VDTQEENGFKMSPRQLSSAITKRTRAVIINSPSNPTGAVYTPQELKALAAVLVDKDILVVTDDIYEKIFYADFPFANIASVEEKIKEKTIVINGVSKTYAMTGWRIGYAACSEEIAGAMSKIQSQSTSNPTSIAQKAALEAIRGDQSAMPQMVVEFRKRRDFIVEALNNIEGIDCFAPGGAFYVFPKVSGLYGRMFKGKKITDSAEFIGYLLDEANVAAVPGAAFGSDEHIRLSYATSLQNIEEGLKRIKNAVGRLD
jgi:aspartate aminotransferase